MYKWVATKFSKLYADSEKSSSVQNYDLISLELTLYSIISQVYPTSSHHPTNHKQNVAKQKI